MLSKSVEILETERLALREKEPADAKVFYNLNLDSEVMRYTGDLPFKDLKVAEKFLIRYSDYRKYGYGRWAVFRKEDKVVLGWCGLKYHPEEDFADLGYRFFQKFWGKGNATEAALGCLGYGFNNLNLATVIGRVLPENRPRCAY